MIRILDIALICLGMIVKFIYFADTFMYLELIIISSLSTGISVLGSSVTAIGKSMFKLATKPSTF